MPARIAASMVEAAVAANGPAQLITASASRNAASRSVPRPHGIGVMPRRRSSATTKLPVWPLAPSTATRLFMIQVWSTRQGRASVRNDVPRTVPDMTSVALAVADGTPLFELAAACEVFGVDRGLADPWYDFTICGPDGAEVGGWLTAGIRYGLDALADAHTVIIPSCRDVAEPPLPALVEAVRAAHAAGARVASLCTGAFVLAEAGLLDGRRATTHWAHTALLRERYPAVEVDPDVLYIDDGDVLTSAGKAAGMDLCLHLVRVDHGTAVANALARTLVVPPHRPGGQAQYIPAAVGHGPNHVLAELLPWVLERVEHPLSVRDLARRAGMSSRNLARHFNAVTGVSPLRWLLTQRVRRAQELLETSDLSIEQIAVTDGHGYRDNAAPALQPAARRTAGDLPPHLPPMSRRHRCESAGGIAGVSRSAS